MPIPLIDEIAGPVPHSSRPEDFADEMDNWIADQQAVLPQLNAFAVAANALATDVSAKKDAVDAAVLVATQQVGLAQEQAELAAEQVGYAEQQVALAENQVGLAAGHAATALNAPGTNATSTTSVVVPTSLPAVVSLVVQPGKLLALGMTVKIAAAAAPMVWMLGEVTAYNSGTGALEVSVNQSRGVGTYADWVVSLASGVVSPITNQPKGVVAKTAGFTVTQDDIGTFFSCTGTFTVNYDPAANLGDAFYHFIRNDGSGTITVDANGAELIDLVANVALLRGESMMVMSDGTALRIFRFSGKYRVYTSSGSYPRSESSTSVDVILIGGGGGGGGGVSANTGQLRYGGAGGGGGGISHRRFPTYLLGASTTVTVGAGGAGGTGQSGSAPGSAGGDSTFGSWLRACGGKGGGVGGASSGAGGVGGLGSLENGGNGANGSDVNVVIARTKFAGNGGGNGRGVDAAGAESYGSPGGSVGDSAASNAVVAGYAQTIAGGVRGTYGGPYTVAGGSAPFGSGVGGAGGGGGHRDLWNGSSGGSGGQGGDGGTYGGGGGGGGCLWVQSGTPSFVYPGNGGAGGAGIAIILEN